MDSTTVLVTGGATSPTSVTEYSSLHLEEVVVREVGDLLAGRWHHACGAYRLGEVQVAHSPLPPYSLLLPTSLHPPSPSLVQMVLVSGGVGAGAALASTEVLEVAEGRWRSASPLPSPRWGVRGTAVAGVVHLSGGYDTGYSREVVAWGPGEEEWRLVGRMEHGRCHTPHRGTHLQNTHFKVPTFGIA